MVDVEVAHRRQLVPNDLAPEMFVPSVGHPLPDMPLFLTPGHYIDVPLEATYLAAWRGVPQRWRRELGPHRAPCA